MRVLTTTEAENCTALALNFIEHAASVLSFDAEFALDVWAPFDVPVVVSEGLAQPLPVGLFVFGRRGQDLLEYCVAHLHIAAILHTSGIDADEATPYLGLQVLSPAFNTEHVAAAQPQALALELFVADGTVAAMLIW